MAKIITLPSPILRQNSQPIKIGSESKALIETLQKTLIDTEGRAKGVGLSAVQIGVLKAVFIAYSQTSKKFLVFVNPQITWYSKSQNKGVPETKNKFEGCLSIPGLWALISRSKAIKIKYQTPKGTWQVRKFTGLTATVIQHEYDHLKGMLLIDRALQQKSPIYELALDENKKEFLKKIED